MDAEKRRGIATRAVGWLHDTLILLGIVTTIAIVAVNCFGVSFAIHTFELVSTSEVMREVRDMWQAERDQQEARDLMSAKNKAKAQPQG